MDDVQKEKLVRFVEHMLKWNAKINLIAKSTIEEVWDRHIEDSLQLATHVSRETKSIIDIGSGGGLPAIPLAIMTGLPVYMVESDTRKSVFLKQMLRELNLEGQVFNARIEEVKLTTIAEPVIITARALSELKNICNWVHSLVAKNSLHDYALLLLKGENVSRETIAAQQDWQLDMEVFASKTAQNSAILKINKFGAKNGGNNGADL